MYVGNTTIVESLIKEGMNMSQRFDNGQTPIHMAAEKGKHSQDIKLYTPNVILLKKYIARI